MKNRIRRFHGFKLLKNLFRFRPCPYNIKREHSVPNVSRCEHFSKSIGNATKFRDVLCFPFLSIHYFFLFRIYTRNSLGGKSKFIQSSTVYLMRSSKHFRKELVLLLFSEIRNKKKSERVPPSEHREAQSIKHSLRAFKCSVLTIYHPFFK